MNKQNLWLLSLAVFMVMPAWAAGKLYKWVDENGEVHYSDKLPPESAMQQHKEINQQGVVTKEIDRAKTEQERILEAAEKAAIDAEKSKQAEIEAKQRASDQILLDTFTTERDLLLARDDRLSSMDSILNLTKSNNAVLQTQIDDTNKKITTLQSAGKQAPENLLKKLANLQGQFDKNTAYLVNTEAERTNLSKKFENDLVRYRELKGKSPQAETPVNVDLPAAEIKMPNPPIVPAGPSAEAKVPAAPADTAAPATP
jgi:hypothetical protein